VTLWDFFNSTAGGASILGGILAVAGYFGARKTNRLIAQMHTETQTTLRALGEGQTRLGDILERMETNAEARYRDLKEGLSGRAEA
jgi:hypothetical protein